MLSLISHEISIILIMVLLPALSIPFLYILPKKVNPGWIISAIGLLQIGVGISALIATYQGGTFHQSWSWFVLPNGLSIQIGIHVDLLNALLLLMVTTLSCLVALYTIAYLPPPTNFQRYFSLHSLSVTAMCWLLVADSLWGTFIGWELLSVSSCLLIGFWYQAQDAMQASTSAWVFGKVGSICFLMGLLLVVVELGGCNLSTLSFVNQHTTSELSSKLFLAGCCLVVAAFTKSAQFPFFSWLPHAMVAPTPVSALLHTATVLSAGIYLLVRIQPMLNVELCSLLVILGHLTAFMGAAAALAEPQLKRMLAYSTFSQLGYVVAAIGLGDTFLGVLYLVIHAFAKACLFLLAGIMARFLQSKGVDKKEAYTLSCMGGLLDQLPWVALSYLIAMGGIGVIPGLIGFKAKESILAQTLLWANHFQGVHLYLIIPLLSLVGTGLTSLYMVRSFVHIFLGKPRWTNQPPSSLPTSTSRSIALLLQGTMVMCAICILLVAYLLDNFFILFTAISQVLRQPLVEKISYGILLVIIVWLVISRLKSTKQVNTVATCSNSEKAKTLAPIKEVDRPAPAGLSLLRSKVARRVTMTRRLLEQLISWQPYQSPRKFITFRKLLLYGWYLDAYVTFLAKQVLASSRLVAQVEKWLIEGLIIGLTNAYVKVAHTLYWLDNQLIGGIGNGIAVLSQQGSRLYLYLQGGRIQLYMLWTCIGIGVLSIICIIFIG